MAALLGNPHPHGAGATVRPSVIRYCDKLVRRVTRRRLLPDESVQVVAPRAAIGGRAPRPDRGHAAQQVWLPLSGEWSTGVDLDVQHIGCLLVCLFQAVDDR